ncbi:sialate O-acetylesterase [uncultured Alistipes sp.]|jgi:sialate O-acetylesterase|uniref:sialate O-acetylesterase n=1 Tax=uncultured Alistipes sp. TaxID=538949 RepID=UPI0025EB3B2F|nr:sialate O-acetylesterase [uncultured Alistipes sp.]
MKRLFMTALFGLCASLAGAQSLELPPHFASGMVLQQQADVELWGRAAPGAEVQIVASWDKATHKTVADDSGRWSVVVRTPEASYAPRTLTFACGRECIVLNDLLAGDVWLLGGQSNMQMNFHGNADQPVENAQRILLRCHRPGIRLFQVKNGYAYRESDTIRIEGKWTPADPANVKEFSVVGYIFGEKLHDLLDIPIGLVQSAHGGSTAEAWIDRTALEQFGGFDLNIEAGKVDPVWYGVLPTILYNKMLKPLLPLSIKGVIWYQGEANVGRPEQYKTLFPLLIESWRRYFRNSDMPFYYVQIAPYEHQGSNSAELREAQLEVMQNIPHTGMAVALDAGERNVIHPPRKEVIGERLAYWALNRDYGYTAFGCRGPEFRSMEVRDGRAVLKFDFAPNGLSFFGKRPSGFEIAGKDRIFHPAEVRIAPAFWGNEGLEVWSDKVAEPVAVRYGYTNYVDGSLYNTEGLPASSFRTDNW